MYDPFASPLPKYTSRDPMLRGPGSLYGNAIGPYVDALLPAAPMGQSELYDPWAPEYLDNSSHYCESPDDPMSEVLTTPQLRHTQLPPDPNAEAPTYERSVQITSLIDQFIVDQAEEIESLGLTPARPNGWIPEMPQETPSGLPDLPSAPPPGLASDQAGEQTLETLDGQEPGTAPHVLSDLAPLGHLVEIEPDLEERIQLLRTMQ